MLFSISTGKSGSSWLDRLRTSRGFPVQTSLDLEHVLNPNPNSPLYPDSKIVSFSTPEEDRPSSDPIDEYPTVDRTKISVKSVTRPENKNDDWFDIMSSVLSELFNMGDTNEIARIRAFEKRTFRKQSNPKICVLSASGSVDESCLAGAQRADGVPALSPSSADNSVAEVKQSDVRSRPRKRRVVDSRNPEEEISETVAVNLDLSAFSRTEVTIIDTSAPTWKTEKLIFRKGTVLKIRDKKQSSGNASRKKRKVDQLDDRAVNEEKQQKPSPLFSKGFKDAVREEHLISSNEGSTHNGKREASKATPDKLSQILERRPQFSRSPCKPATKDSSVFLIQCIPTSRKTDTCSLKKCLKDKP